jgi:hypothetical protein
MKPLFNSAGAAPTRTGTDVTGPRELRRLAALEVRVADLDRSRRRSMTMGPILLLVVANVTPLVIVRPRSDPDEQYTLLQVVFGGVKALPVGWFVLLGVVGLLCLGAAVAVGRSTGRAGDTWPVVAAAAALLIVLVVIVMVGSAAGTKNTMYLLLTPASVFGAAAAIWLIVGVRSLRR